MHTKKSIQQLVVEVLKYLKTQGYFRDTIKRYSNTYEDLLVYADQKGVYEYSEAVGLDYLDFRFGFKLEGFFTGAPEDVNRVLRHLVILWHYQEYETLKFVTRLRKKPFSCPICFKKEYDAYLIYCQQKKYTPCGLRTMLRPVQRFLDFLDDGRIFHMENVNMTHISAFFLIYAEYSMRSMTTIVSALRIFFKFLYNEGCLEQKLWDMLPKAKHIRNAFIPSSWKKEDGIMLLKAVDRGNPIGKRDYAILLLVVRLGLRVSDVRNLRLSSLDWVRKKISIIQTKNKEGLELPMLDDIGWALIDYLKNGRPRTRAATVFVSHRAPYGGFKDTDSMHDILCKYIRFAGLPIPKNEHYGLHSLRSTLARTMLENGAPLPTISEVLGHESINTTAIYLKINIDALRKCTIDPDEVFECEA